MANHNSAKKALRQSLKKNLINRARNSRIKTFVKKVESLISSESTKDQISHAFSQMQSELMRSVSKGVMKLNTVSRKISRISKKIKLKFEN